MGETPEIWFYLYAGVAVVWLAGALLYPIGYRLVTDKALFKQEWQLTDYLGLVVLLPAIIWPLVVALLIVAVLVRIVWKHGILRAIKFAYGVRP